MLDYIVGGYMRYKVEEIAPAVDRVLAEQIAALVALLGAPDDATGPTKPDAKAKP